MLMTRKESTKFGELIKSMGIPIPELPLSLNLYKEDIESILTALQVEKITVEHTNILTGDKKQAYLDNLQRIMDGLNEVLEFGKP